MTTLNFQAGGVQPMDEIEALPAGWYPVAIVEETNKQAKSGNGEYLQLTLQVTAGQYQGRKTWWRMNLWNTNQEAVEIAKRELATLCTAVGLPGVGDSTELLNRQFEVKLSVRDDKDYGKQNNVKNARALQGQLPPAPATTAQPAAPASPVTDQPPAVAPADRDWETDD